MTAILKFGRVDLIIFFLVHQFSWLEYIASLLYSFNNGAIDLFILTDTDHNYQIVLT